MSEYYNIIFLSFVTLISLTSIPQYSRFRQMRVFNNTTTSYVSILVLCAIVILFIGFRDPYSPEFGDSQSYSRGYDSILNDLFVMEWDIQNPLFYAVLRYLASLGLPVTTFYLVIAAIYFGGTAYACVKMFPKDSLVAFLVFLAAFSTFSYSINGIKAGAAASLFLIALCLNDNRVKYWPWVFLALCIGFHHSMRVPVVAFVVCKFIKNPKFFTYFWFICFLCAALHISYFQNLFASMGDEKTIAYLGDTEGFVRGDIMGGFRIDFILYSAMPILVGWYGIYKQNIKSKSFEFILNLYTFVNAIWMLCIYASFTNRIAYLSWLMYPIVLIYPLLKENWGANQYKVFTRVAMLHLAFTLFMSLVYYR